MLELRIRADKSGDPPAEGEPWPLSHVELVGDAPAAHNFADTFVSDGLERGFVKLVGAEAHVTPGYDRNPVLTGKAIEIKVAGGKLRYRVIEPPGRYTDEDGTVRVSHEYRCELED